MKKGIIFLFIIFMLFLNIISHVSIDKIRKNFIVKYSSPEYRIPFEMLKIVAGEFKGIVADFLLLESGSFIGSNQDINSDDWENLYNTFKQSLILDPYFQQAYLYVQGNLPWERGMTNKSIELLNISKKYRDWDWRPGYYIGFDYYYFLNDYNKASEIFLETGKMPDAPVLLSVLGARFALKNKRTQSAILVLKSMLQDKDLNDLKKRELENRILALEGVLLLGNGINLYKQIYNFYPSSLDELILQGLIPYMPENPYAKSFFYDEITGEVFFDQINKK